MKYRIAWRSRITGATGHGEPVFRTLKMVDEIVKQLNRERPELSHWWELVVVMRRQKEAQP
jgi:hypothetical protein